MILKNLNAKVDKCEFITPKWITDELGSINLTTEYLNENAFSDDFVSDVEWGDKKAFCYA